MGTGFSPLDERLGLLPGSQFTPWLVDSIVCLGARLPFGQVPALRAHFTGVTVSAETVRRLTETAGTAAVASEMAAVERLEQTLPDPPPGPPVQQLSVDGAMVPLVGGEWAEAKTLAVGTVTGTGDAVRATELSYFSRLTDADTFGWLATGETHRRGTTTARTVVAVVDGAAWCQSFIDLHRPDAVRILDFPHALEHLGAVAQAVFGPGTVAASEWLGIQATALRHGQEGAVLAPLMDVASLGGLGNETRHLVTRTHAYLATRRDQIQYQVFVAAGYPIGSGCVESANKVVVEARLKGPGMHWARSNVDPMLALRTVIANDRWTEVWPVIWEQLRHPPRHPPLMPVPPIAAPPPARTAPAPAPPRPRAKTIVDGRPTADHPWRRSSPYPAKC